MSKLSKYSPKKAPIGITPRAYAIYAVEEDNTLELVEFISDRIEAKERAKRLNEELEHKRDNPPMLKSPLRKPLPKRYTAEAVDNFRSREYYLEADFLSFAESGETSGWEMDAKMFKKELMVTQYGEYFYRYNKQDTKIDFDDSFGDGVWIDSESQKFGFSSGGMSDLIDMPEEVDDFLREHFRGEDTFAIRGLMRKTRENCW